MLTSCLCSEPPLLKKRYSHCIKTSLSYTSTMQSFKSFLNELDTFLWKLSKTSVLTWCFSTTANLDSIGRQSWKRKIKLKKTLLHKLCAFRCLEFETSADVFYSIQILKWDNISFSKTKSLQTKPFLKNLLYHQQLFSLFLCPQLFWVVTSSVRCL